MGGPPVTAAAVAPVDATSAAFGIGATYTPAGGGTFVGAVARRPSTIRGAPHPGGRAQSAGSAASSEMRCQRELGVASHSTQNASPLFRM